MQLGTNVIKSLFDVGRLTFTSVQQMSSYVFDIVLWNIHLQKVDNYCA